MGKGIVVFTAVMALSLPVIAQGRGSGMKATHLRCEYLENPLGIDETKPRLSWMLESTVRGQKQTAYRILVASTREKLDGNIGDLWDTGKVTGDASSQIVYAGAKLGSRMTCYWKVRAWDKDDVQTAFSESALWTMGLIAASDWKGSWIAMDRKEDIADGKEDTEDGKEEAGESKEDAEESKELEPGPPPPYFRKTFSLEKSVRKAVVYVTARGLFELSANGSRVGRDFLAPEWTDYNKHIQYRTYDVTPLLKTGNNAIGAIVGDGWYSGYIGWRRTRGYYGLVNSLLVQLEVEFTDGTKRTIVTDDSWRCAEGPIVSSDIMQGEHYNACLEMPGWNTAAFSDAGWKKAKTVEKPAARIVSQPAQPVRVTEEIVPVSITEPRKGVYVFDLGQNIAGWVRLRVNGPRGAVVTLRFGERLSPSGTVYTTNLMAAKVTDTYVLKGGGEEVFEPRFTFHGFQYVELVGYPGRPGKQAITGCVVHSDTQRIGTFECSSPMVNKLVSNIDWGQRGNFISIPTDCPQRDERLGWMGDAQIFVRSATFNRDVAGFFTKWVTDVVDAQSEEGAFADFSPRLQNDERPFEGAPAWGDAGIIVPWTIYRVYGDTRIIEKNFDAMERWMAFLRKENPDLLRRNRLGNNYGDWLSIQADTPKDLLATAYWAIDARLMADMARAIGRSQEAGKYDRLYNDVREAFRKNYIDADGHVFQVFDYVPEDAGMDASGTERTTNKSRTQTSYLLALYYSLLPDDLREKAAEHLVTDIREKDWHLSTGFIGVRHLNPVLTQMGKNDTAYRLLLNDTFPSWGYSIKHGATTIWERWDGWTEEKGFQDPGMNSFNHYSLGSVGEWLFRFAAGIQLDPNVPAYKQFVISPNPDKHLEYARAEYRSIHGAIESGWRLDGTALELDVTVPANTTAVVRVPAADASQVKESGKPADSAEGVTFRRYDNGRAIYTVGSGTYRFTSTITE